MTSGPSDAQPATTPASVEIRLLAQAVGDHLPCELALRAGDLAAQLDANIDPGGGW